MTIKTSGPISFADIRAEYGGRTPVSFNDYNLGSDTRIDSNTGLSGYVNVATPAGTGSFQTAPYPYSAPAQIAGGSPIQLSQFYGVTRYVPPPAYGTFIRSQCSGVNMHAVRADGGGGEYLAEVTEYNSAACGYTPPVVTDFAPLQPFGGDVTALGSSQGNSSSVTIELLNDGSATIQGNPEGDNNGGDWKVSQAVAADYEVNWTSSSNEISASSTKDTWGTLANGWFGGLSSNSVSPTNKDDNFATMTVTIRQIRDHSLSVSFRAVMRTSTYVYLE